MSEIEHLIAELSHAHAGDPWHGPSRAAVLENVGWDDAASRPPGDAHSIWELVLHMTAWTREVARRLRDGVARSPELGDWPPVPEPSATAWSEARSALDRAHADLIASLRTFPEERLDERVGAERDAPLGAGVSYRAMLHGIAQHDAYHSGQIAILARIVRAPRP
jgi:uncharacterized damage-inducible protein DinB